jgi:short-subunit dehydrogenase
MRPLALITGASSGIGAAFAWELASRGNDLILVARRRDRLEEMARAIEQKFGIAAGIVAADLATEEGLGVVEQRITVEDNLELLVNNAGFGTRGLFFRADVQGQDQIHRLHVLATVRLTHAALNGMVRRGKGGIINVSSVAAFWQSPGSVSYCATKCWMNSFTEGLAMELRVAGSAVKMQALCPGYTRSEFHDAAGMDRKLIAESLWMSAEEVVAASLEGLHRGKLVVVPGLRYRMVVFFMKHAPQWVLHPIAVQQQRRLRRSD